MKEEDAKPNYAQCRFYRKPPIPEQVSYREQWEHQRIHYLGLPVASPLSQKCYDLAALLNDIEEEKKNFYELNKGPK